MLNRLRSVIRSGNGVDPSRHSELAINCLDLQEFTLAAGAGMTKERRRLGVYQGKIILDGILMRCKVRHLTATSATIQTLDAPSIPAAFALRIPSADIDARCQVVWRDERRLGVTFV